VREGELRAWRSTQRAYRQEAFLVLWECDDYFGSVMWHCLCGGERVRYYEDFLLRESLPTETQGGEHADGTSGGGEVARTAPVP
jgi:hypothetical protein